MKDVVFVCAAIGEAFHAKGERFVASMRQFAPGYRVMLLRELPAGCPSHADAPYAFKHAAMMEAAKTHKIVFWCDASTVAIRDITPLVREVRSKGHFFARNGWSVGQWSTDAALESMGLSREDAFKVPDLVGGVWGVNLNHAKGRAVLDMLGAEIRKGVSFRGAWQNSNASDAELQKFGMTRRHDAGPVSSDPRVLGHRHDQTVLSIIAHKLGLALTDPPRLYAYGDESHEETCIISKG